MIYHYICDYYIYICGLAWMSCWSVASMDFLPSSDGHWVFFCCPKSAARELIPKIHKVHLNNEKKQWFPVIPGSKNQWCAFLWTSTTPKSQVHQCSSMFLLKSVYWLVVLTILNNMSSSMGRMTSHILWNIKTTSLNEHWWTLNHVFS